jgi:hypothetical protein
LQLLTKVTLGFHFTRGAGLATAEFVISQGPRGLA